MTTFPWGNEEPMSKTASRHNSGSRTSTHSLENIFNEIQAAGLATVRVESISDQPAALAVAGGLNEFISAAKAIGSNVIFVSTDALTEEHFCYESEDDEDDSIDLLSVLPKLSAYKKKIGTLGKVDLFAPAVTCAITLSLVENWWYELAELYAEAVGIVDEQRASELADAEEEEKRQNQATLAKLRILINDKNFTSLPTQRAMRAYALEKLPALKDIDDQALREELSNLNALIQAKGYRRK